MDGGIEVRTDIRESGPVDLVICAGGPFEDIVATAEASTAATAEFVIFGVLEQDWGTDVGVRAEALVHARRASGAKAALVSWGPHEHARPGLRPLHAASVFAALPWGQWPDPVLAVADVEWSTLVPGMTRSLRRAVGDVPAARAALSAVGGGIAAASTGPVLAGDLRDRFAEADGSTRHALALEAIRLQGSALLGVAPGAFDMDRDFLALGFSSFTVLELCTALSAATGVELPPAAVYEHPGPAELAAYVVARWEAGAVVA